MREIGHASRLIHQVRETMEIDERVWKVMQKRLGYSDEEMVLFRADPRNADVISRGASLADKRVSSWRWSNPTVVTAVTRSATGLPLMPLAICSLACARRRCAPTR